MNEFALFMVTSIFLTVVVSAIVYTIAQGLEKYPIVQMMWIAFAISLMVSIHFKIFESIDIVFKFT